MIGFEGRVALITGAGRGLGLAYARLLAECGAKVIVHDVGAGNDGTGEDAAIAATAAEALRAAGLMATAASGAIDTREGCRRLVDATLAEHGRLDIIIHNAGWVAYQAIEDLDERFLARMLAVGVGAPLWLAQAAWPAMKAEGFGRILLTTSDRALYPRYVQLGLAAYAAAKMAAVGAVNVLAREGAAHGIVVNAISPVAKTRMWGVDGQPDELQPEKVAPGAAFLVSDACEEGGWILRASNGQFHATKACEAPGVSYPRDLRAVAAGSIEDVAAAWSRVAVAGAEARS